MRAPATCPSILRAGQRYSGFELVRFMGFACVYIPDFLVQAVVRGQRTLGDQALALLGGAPPLWSVVAANPAAFAAGIHLGMTKAQVAQFGDVVGARDTRARPSNVQICTRSESQEKAAHAALLDAAWSVSPRVEDTAPDTVVLDLEGLASLLGTDEHIAQELARRVAAIGLAARVAVAENMEVAIHAARFGGVAGLAAFRTPGTRRRAAQRTSARSAPAFAGSGASFFHFYRRDGTRRRGGRTGAALLFVRPIAGPALCAVGSPSACRPRRADLLRIAAII